MRLACTRLRKPSDGLVSLSLFLYGPICSVALLSPYAAALARFSHAAGTTDRVRRQALKGRSTQVSRASHCVDSEGKLTNHQAAATRAAREAGVTLQDHLDELEATLEEQLEHEAITIR